MNYPARSRAGKQLRVIPQLIRYHAAWMLPIGGPPIRDGWVAVDGGRIVALGADGPARRWRDGARERRSRRRRRSCPGSSTRTPISSCRTCAIEVPPASQFVDVDPRRDGGAARSVPIRARRRFSTRVDARDRAKRCAAARRSSATSATRWSTFAPLARSALGGVVFYELIRFNPPTRRPSSRRRDASSRR